MKRISRCPIEAAFMMKRYGVRFLFAEEIEGKTYLYAVPLWRVVGMFNDWRDNDDLIVHSEDEHIFKPMDEDKNDDGFLFEDGRWAKYLEPNHKNNERRDKIVLRSGRPFFCGDIV
jgi:hypothetical protein